MQHKKTKAKRIIIIAATVVVFAAAFWLLNRLVQPKYMTDLVEGSMLSQYYEEAGEHDVIFIGDCEVYSNFSPVVLWQEKGITSYVRGASQMMMWQEYYILEETLRYETPKAVVVTVNPMREPFQDNEAYNRLAIDKLKWSPTKYRMVKASLTEGETVWDYIFPVLRYHTRITELKDEDFEYLFKRKDTTYNGYLMSKVVNPLTSLPAKRPLADYSFSDNCWEYLEKITELCKANDIDLILFKAPRAYPYWYDEYSDQIAEYAEENGLSYYNFAALIDEIGIDFTQDTIDQGQHLNLYGAEKFSAYFADILADEHGLEDHRADAELSALYDELTDKYEAAKMAE